jgi:hypothetical protein
MSKRNRSSKNNSFKNGLSSDQECLIIKYINLNIEQLKDIVDCDEDIINLIKKKTLEDIGIVKE